MSTAPYPVEMTHKSSTSPLSACPRSLVQLMIRSWRALIKDAFHWSSEDLAICARGSNVHQYKSGMPSGSASQVGVQRYSPSKWTGRQSARREKS